MDKIVIVKTMI